MIAQLLRLACRGAWIARTFAVVLAVTTVSACATPSSGPQGAHDDAGAQNLLALADATLAGGDARAAVTLYRRAIAAAPEAVGPRLALAEAYYRIGSLTEARVAYAAVRDDAPIDADIGLGRVALALMQGDVAARHFAAVLTAEPDNVEALNGVGVAHDLVGQHQRAQLAYAEALAVDPTNRAVANNEALSLILSGDWDGAVERLQRLAGDALSFPEARHNLALAYGLAGDETNARRLLAAELGAEEVDDNLAFYRAARGLSPAAGG